MPNLIFLKKYIGLVIIAVVLIGGISAALIIGGSGSPTKKNTQPRSSSACGNYRDDTTVAIAGHTFKTEVAKSAEEYDKGLAGRPCITAHEAMLFAFTKPGLYPFWMKGMKFPIDIIWIGADHKVAGAEIDELPSTYPDKFVSQKPAQYVLEIKANLSKQLHLAIGTPVSL